MTDHLTRAYRLQLTTAIENLMRTAVVEISQIFEASLRDHHLEIARRGDEVACLKVKLQSLETKLKDISILSEIDTRNSVESEEPNESTAPELDFEAPDDWCVPLGSENVVKQEIPCPSVRLKQFSIRLWPMSLKHEAFQKLKEPRLRSRRDRVVKELENEKKPQSPVKRGPGRPRIQPLKEDRPKDGLLNVKEEPSDSEVEPPMLRRRDLSGKVQKTHKRARAHQTPHSSTELKHQCRFCPKGFDTPLGLSVHERGHKKCQGCKRIFPFPTVLMQHKNQCKYYKVLMKLSNPLPKTSRNSPCTKRDSTTSVKRTSVGRVIKGHSKKFDSHNLLLKHSCNFPCQFCHKTFPSLLSLKVHTGRMHKNSTGRSGTKPLNEFNKKQVSKFETKIKKCQYGYQCLICKKIYTNKYNAMDHMYFHTGQKFSCDMCAKKFAHRSTLCEHRIKSHGLRIRTYATCACSKTFVHESEFKAHTLNCPAITKTKNKA